MTDDDLIRVCFEFRVGLLNGRDPEGCCAMVAIPLAGYLRAAHNVQCATVKNDLTGQPLSTVANHVWILLGDGRALDPTYDQFGIKGAPPIYLGEPTLFHTDTPRAEGAA
ncbi:MAG: hypothetical protein LC676_10900 [Loktanella sp.]|nr:hypothetical protein [Loktanella sp.]